MIYCSVPSGTMIGKYALYALLRIASTRSHQAQTMTALSMSDDIVIHENNI